ncbi:hypothetical protein PR048_011263 [Dryococelus australis]|uniref:Mutator-like transposase domain-containing protein n=1 Tax=Dryococelus australis TaxID=614101 RepID=A0ABQ9HLF6_9NEOP|nr:hypothetical protein PR048_011263 [Dryococelus australis]
MAEHDPVNCYLKSKEHVLESGQGFRSRLHFKFNLDKKIQLIRRQWNVNAAAVCGVLSIGVGLGQLEGITPAFNMLNMSSLIYSKIHDTVSRGLFATSLDEMKMAAEEVRLAVEAGEVYVDGLPLVAVVADRYCSKRSYREPISLSLSGVVRSEGVARQVREQVRQAVFGKIGKQGAADRRWPAAKWQYKRVCRGLLFPHPSPDCYCPRPQASATHICCFGKPFIQQASRQSDVTLRRRTISSRPRRTRAGHLAPQIDAMGATRTEVNVTARGSTGRLCGLDAGVWPLLPRTTSPINHRSVTIDTPDKEDIVMGKPLLWQLYERTSTSPRRATEHGKEQPLHTCYKNWSQEQSSSSMEADIIADGICRREETYCLSCGTLIADGDSIVYKKLLEARQYINPTVDTLECRNYLLHYYGNKLKYISTTGKNGLFHPRKLIYSKSLQFRCDVVKSAKHRMNEEVAMRERTANLRKDIINSIDNVFGDQQLCASYFCAGANEGNLCRHSRSLLNNVDNNCVREEDRYQAHQIHVTWIFSGVIHRVTGCLQFGSSTL